MENYSPSLPDTRLLWRTLAASLLLHALLLIPARGLQPIEAGAPAEPNPLRARLSSAAAVTPPRAETPPAEPLATPEPRPADNRRPEPTARTAEPDATPAPPAPDTAARSETAPPLATPETWRPRIDTTGLRQYHLALGQSASRFRVYPPALREAGVSGRVTLRLAVGEDGRPIAIALLGTSGNDELDAAAVEMMRLAASHTPVPQLLQGQPFTIDLVVNYDPGAEP